MRHLLTAFFLVAAAALYLAGLDGGGLACFVAGGACELAFWVRVVRRPVGPSAVSPPL